MIEDEIRRLEKEYADFDEVLRAEKRRAGLGGDQGRDRQAEGDHGRTASARASTTSWPRSSMAGCRSWRRSCTRRRRAARSRSSGCCARKSAAEEIAEVVSRATGIPVAKMCRASARSCWRWSRSCIRAWSPGRGGAAGVRRHPPLARRAGRSQPPLRLVSCSSARRAVGKTDCARRWRVPGRQRGAPCPRRLTSTWRSTRWPADRPRRGLRRYEEGGQLTEQVRPSRIR